MDVSKEYIKMCIEAKEIQEGWEPTCGDSFIMTDKLHKRILIDPEAVKRMGREKFIWLPHQDQLQEMIGKCKWEQLKALDEILNLLHSRSIVVKEHINNNESVYLNLLGDVDETMYPWIKNFQSFRQFNSMEELWLGYIMKKKHNKHWNNNTWEIIT